MEKLLFFGTDTDTYQNIKQIANRLKLRCEQITPAYYTNTLEDILCNNYQNTPSPLVGNSGSANSNIINTISSKTSESLLLMCDLPDKRMDKLLFELRRANVQIDYKAILTPTNRKWTVLQLMLEMHKEKIAFQRVTH